MNRSPASGSAWAIGWDAGGFDSVYSYVKGQADWTALGRHSLANYSGRRVYIDSTSGKLQGDSIAGWVSALTWNATGVTIPSGQTLTIGGVGRTTWPEAGITGATVAEGSPLGVTTNAGVLALTIPAPGVSASTVTGIVETVIAPYTNHQDRADNPHATTLQQAVTAGGTVTSGVVTIDAANDRTNTFGGKLTILGETVRAGLNTTVGVYGFGAGYTNTVGDFGFGAGLGNTVDAYGFAAGQNNTVGYSGFGAGYGNVVGRYGFGAGYRGNGGEGSFVFSDLSSGDYFDRSAYINEWAMRVQRIYWKIGGVTVTKIETSVTDSDNAIPTSGAVVDYVAANGGVSASTVTGIVETVAAAPIALEAYVSTHVTLADAATVTIPGTAAQYHLTVTQPWTLSLTNTHPRYGFAMMVRGTNTMSYSPAWIVENTNYVPLKVNAISITPYASTNWSIFAVGVSQ
jgi:hypothetical protein